MKFGVVNNKVERVSYKTGEVIPKPDESMRRIKARPSKSGPLDTEPFEVRLK